MEKIVRNSYIKTLEIDQKHTTNWEMFLQEVLYLCKNSEKPVF